MSIAMDVQPLTRIDSAPALTHDEDAIWGAFGGLLADMAVGASPEELAQVLLARLPQILPVSFCAVCLTWPDRAGFWRAGAQVAAKPLSHELLDQTVELCRQELLAGVPGTEELRLAGIDTSGALVDPEAGSLAGMHAGPLLMVPVRNEQVFFGALAVGKDGEGGFTARERLQLSLVAEHLARFLEVRTLARTTALWERELELVYQTSQRITQLLDLSELMPQLVTALNETFGYESVTLLLVDRESSELVVREAYGLRKERHVGFRIPITATREGGIVGFVAAQGVSLLVPDVLANERYIRTVEETRSELAVPLRIKEQVIGVLDIQSTAIHGITEKDRYIIETLADQVAIALENARLYEDLARANAKIRRQAYDLRQLLQRTVRIQEQERHRIAADIHDDVNQWLYAAMYETEAALQSLPAETDAVRDSLQQVQSSLDQALVDMRKAIFDLWPTSLDEMGLLPSIQSSLNRLEKTHGVKCKLKIQGTPIRFAPLARITIYRIVQEALQNARKHAHAKTVTVSFVFSDSQVVLRIEDDGRGFGRSRPLRSGGSHLGLISMQERARSLGGRSRFASGKGGGASLVFEFPMAMVSREGGAREGIDQD